MKLLDRLKSIVSKNPEKITEGLEKVTTQIDKRTGGKYHDKIEKVSDSVEGQIEKLAGDDIDLTDEPTDVTDAAEAARAAEAEQNVADTAAEAGSTDGERKS